MNLLLLFILLNIANVVLQTAKSICTVKCGKTVAAIANAVAYGLYTVVIVYTVCDLSLWLKIIVVALANFVGVYVVKAVEQKMEKEKLWKIEMAIPVGTNPHDIHRVLEQCGIANNWNNLGSWHIYNCYCYRKSQTQVCQVVAKENNGKISAYQAAPLVW